MFENAHQLDSDLRRNQAPPQHRVTSSWYFVGALVVFAVTTVLISQVHKHRTKAPQGALMDGEERVALAGDALVGDGSVPAEYRAELSDALRSGSLYGATPGTPQAGKIVAAKSAPPKSESPFRLLTPVGVTIVADQPLLDWEDLDDVEEYQVRIYDEKDELITESPLLAASAWRPAEGLDRDQTYHWVVEARLRDKTVRVPAEGQPEARFHVASQMVADQLLLLQAQYPDHHLLLATLFARAGDKQAASRELDLAEEQNGSHPLLQKLRASLGRRPPPANAQ